VTRDERLTGSRAAGVVFAIGGVAVLVGGDAPAAWNGPGLGQGAVLAAAVCYAGAGVYGRRFRALSPVAAAAGMLWGSTLLMLPLALVVETPWRADAGASSWLAVAGLAVSGTAAADVVYFSLLARAGATNLLRVTFLMPAVALVLGVFALGEVVPGAAWAGLALIIAGLAVIDGRAVVLVAGRWRGRHVSRPLPLPAKPRRGPCP